MEPPSMGRKVLASLPIFILVIGTIGNFLTVILIWSRKTLRKHPSFVFMAFISFVDTICLYFYNLYDFFLTLFHINIMGITNFTCRSVLFFQGISFFSSSWLLVIMSFERYLAISVMSWKRVKFDTKRAVIVSCLTILFAIGLSIPALFASNFAPTGSNITYEGVATKTINGICYVNKLYDLSAQTQLYAYSIGPFLLITIANLLMMKTLICNSKTTIKRSDEDKSKRRAISISIMIISMLFIVMTLPNAVFVGYFLRVFLKSPERYTIFTLMCLLAFAYKGLNFFILVGTNRVFRNELKSMIFRSASKYEPNIVTSNTSLTKK